MQTVQEIIDDAIRRAIAERGPLVDHSAHYVAGYLAQRLHAALRTIAEITQRRLEQSAEIDRLLRIIDGYDECRDSYL